MTEPTVCEPSASVPTPAATAAAEPLLEPPGVCSRLRGFAVAPGAKKANSVVTVLPRISAPARRSRSTASASRPLNDSGGTAEPARVGMRSTLKMSLTSASAPKSGGRSAGSGQRSRSARASAASRSRCRGSGRTARMWGLTSASRSRARSISASSETWPPRRRPTCSVNETGAARLGIAVRSRGRLCPASCGPR